MKHAADTLDALGIAYEARIVSAHRTPDRLYAFAKGAKAAGVRVIIAGAGGAAHLPGMTASMTVLPVFGVPIESKALAGLDSLYSMVQMPPGVPVGTLAIGRAGAINAALLAASVLALPEGARAGRLEAGGKCQTDAVAEAPSGEGGACPLSPRNPSAPMPPSGFWVAASLAACLRWQRRGLVSSAMCFAPSPPPRHSVWCVGSPRLTTATRPLSPASSTTSVSSPMSSRTAPPERRRLPPTANAG